MIEIAGGIILAVLFFIALPFLLIIALLAVIYPAVKAAVIKPVAALHYR